MQTHMRVCSVVFVGLIELMAQCDASRLFCGSRDSTRRWITANRYIVEQAHAP